MVYIDGAYDSKAYGSITHFETNMLGFAMTWPCRLSFRHTSLSYRLLLIEKESYVQSGSLLKNKKTTPIQQWGHFILCPFPIPSRAKYPDPRRFAFQITGSGSLALFATVLRSISEHNASIQGSLSYSQGRMSERPNSAS
jgi:hypothetical protein